jgi:hypothetical protein
MTIERIRAWWKRNGDKAARIPKEAWDELDGAIRADERTKMAATYTQVRVERLEAQHALMEQQVLRLSLNLPADGEFDAETAFSLMNKGVWLESGGYTWRNVTKGGQYWAYGEFPECIRGGNYFTLESVRSVGDVWRLPSFERRKYE